MRQRHFEIGEKPDKLILLTDPKDINNCFKDFYSELYTSNSTATYSDLTHLFDSLEIPKLSNIARSDLDSNFILEDIVAAI